MNSQKKSIKKMKLQKIQRMKNVHMLMTLFYFPYGNILIVQQSTQKNQSVLKI